MMAAPLEPPGVLPAEWITVGLDLAQENQEWITKLTNHAVAATPVQAFRHTYAGRSMRRANLGAVPTRRRSLPLPHRSTWTVGSAPRVGSDIRPDLL